MSQSKTLIVLVVFIIAIIALSQAESSDETLSFLDVIGNAFSAINLQADEKVPSVSLEIPSETSTESSTESVLSTPIQSVVSDEQEYEYIPSTDDTDRPSDSFTGVPPDPTAEVSSVQFIVSDDEPLSESFQDFSSVQSVVSDSLEYEEPTLILNPEVFRLPEESVEASSSASVHAVEALEGQEPKLSELLQLLTTINGKTESLDADEQGIIDQVKSLLENYKKAIA